MLITCRILADRELPLYADYLKDRTEQSLALYFGTAIGSSYIDFLVDKIIKEKRQHKILVAENDQLEIVGTIHIAYIDDSKVEFGVMVAESHRKLGISSQMMDYALTWCRNRNRNDVYMHCLGHNEAIIHLVRKYGLQVSKDHGDADAHVTLPHGTFFTLQKEAVIRQTTAFQQNFLNFMKLVQL